jgi:hypothetical protein
MASSRSIGRAWSAVVVAAVSSASIVCSMIGDFATAEPLLMPRRVGQRASR